MACSPVQFALAQKTAIQRLFTSLRSTPQHFTPHSILFHTSPFLPTPLHSRNYFNSLQFYHLLLPGLTHQGLKTDLLSRTMFGIVLGVNMMMIFISLQTAIFWGQYANCESYTASMEETNSPTTALISRRLVGEIIHSSSSSSSSITNDNNYNMDTGDNSRRLFGVVCEHQGAMHAASFFSVVLFLSYLALLGVLIKFKNEILGTAPLNGNFFGFPCLIIFLIALQSLESSIFKRENCMVMLFVMLFVVQSISKRLQTLRNRSVMILLSHSNALRSLFNLSAIAMQSLCDRNAIAS
jgi:hypothetical protein